MRHVWLFLFSCGPLLLLPYNTNASKTEYAWGAFAIDRYGKNPQVVYDHTSKQSARQAVLAICPKCKVKMTFRDKCFAFAEATGTGKGYSYSTRSSIHEARESVKSRCEKKYKTCQVKLSGCATAAIYTFQPPLPKGFQREEHTERSGKHYRVWKAPNEEACFRSCMRDTRCRVAVFEAKPSQQCWLKAQRLAKKKAKTKTSFVRSEPAKQPHPRPDSNDRAKPTEK